LISRGAVSPSRRGSIAADAVRFIRSWNQGGPSSCRVGA
jgi:hypothetical protein